MKKYFAISFVCACSFFWNAAAAQNALPIPGCPYQFSKDLKKGDTDQDVIVMQQILNSDSRTRISNSGVGSPGNETNLFGVATREALKRFQALFIEFVGTANGIFDAKTRRVMQQICDSQNDKVGNVPSSPVTNASVPATPLRITLTPNTNQVAIGSTFKVVVDMSKQVDSFSANSIIVDGGAIKEARKLGKTKYLLIISPNNDAKNVDMQIEAETVTASDNTVNGEASNEVVVQIASADNSLNINATGTDATAIQNALNAVSTQNCYGNVIPINSTCTNPNAANTALPQQAQSPMNSLMQMLPGLLKSFGAGGNSTGANTGQQNGNNGSRSTNPSGTPGPANQTPDNTQKTQPESKTDVQKATELVAEKCKDDDATQSDECVKAQAQLVEAQAKALEAEKAGGSVNSKDCEGKKIIMVGFTGIPSNSIPKPSDGVTTAVQKCKGKEFAYTQSKEATQYVLDMLKEDNNSCIVIVGHSGGANTAVTTAQFLIQKANLKINSLILADPSKSFAGMVPAGIPHTVGLISSSEAYKGLKMNTGDTQNYDQPNGPRKALNHFQVDNLIPNNVPCK